MIESATARAARLKEALASGNATVSTITELEGFLGDAAGRQTQEKPQSGQKTSIHDKLKARHASQDDSWISQRRRLATELAMSGSKYLAAATSASTASTKDPMIAILPSQRQALLPRSGNSTPSPKKHGKMTIQSTQDKIHNINSTAQLEIVAQSTHIAMSYLRSTHSHETRTRLIEGSLAFAKHLLAHGFHQLLLLELAGVRSLLPLKGTTSLDLVKKCTNLDLLNIDAGVAPEHLRLAIIYQNLVVKTLAASPQPTTFTDLASIVASPDRAPHVLIEQYIHTDKDKAAIYLESLASELLTFSSAQPKDSEDHVNIASAQFKIRSYVLGLRRRWWILAKHKVDVQHTLNSQFRKILTTFSNSTYALKDPAGCLHVAEAAYAFVFDAETAAGLEVLDLIHTLATKVHTRDTSWSRHRDACVDTLNEHDCRKLAKQIQALSEQTDPESINEELEHVNIKLKGVLKGQGEHYAVLLTAIARFLRKHSSSSAKPSVLQFVRCAVRLTCWTSKTQPELEPVAQRSIIRYALRCPRSQLLAWIDEQVLQVLAEADVLASIYCSWRTNSLKSAFGCSTDAVALAELIDLLVSKDIKNGTNSLDQFASPAPIHHKALLWEWQLRACLKHSVRSATHDSQAKLCKTLLSKLKEVYDRQHPVRRALIGLHAAVAAGKGIMTSAEAQDYITTIDTGNLYEDSGLGNFVPDIRNSLSIALFLQQSERIDILQSALRSWQKLLTATTNPADLDHAIYDRTIVLGLLECAASLCSALGRYDYCSTAHSIRSMLIAKFEPASTRHIQACIALAESHLFSCRDDQAQDAVQSILDMTAPSTDVPGNLYGMLLISELRVQQQRYQDAKMMLAKVETATLVTSTSNSNIDKKDLPKLCLRVWRLKSQLCVLGNDFANALQAARCATSIANALWRQVEQRDTGSNTVPDTDDDTTVNVLTDKVSKLQLRPNIDSGCKDVAQRGAAFWDLVPLVCSTLMHISEVYEHAGLFAEAHAHASHAVRITDSIPGSSWGMRTRARLSDLLVLSGRLDDAELCLAKLSPPAIAVRSIDVVGLYRARARLCMKQGETETALEHLTAAENNLLKVESQDQVQQSSSVKPQPVTTTRKRTTTKPVTTKRVPQSKRSRANPMKTPSAADSIPTLSTSLLCLLDEIRVDKAMMGAVTKSYKPLVNASTLSSRYRQLQHLEAMSGFEVDSQAHVVFNALIESSLLCPNLTMAQHMRNETVGSFIPVKKTSKKYKALESLSQHLFKAQTTLHMDKAFLDTGIVSTANAHIENSMLLGASIFSSATILSSEQEKPTLGQLALVDEKAASLAKTREQEALAVDIASKHKASTLVWPHQVEALAYHRPDAYPTQDLSDLLPQSWTVVSLSLSHDLSDLVVIRQQHGEEPLLARLPFAKQDMDAGTSNSFDFAFGKTELTNIIEQSNAICHSSGDASKRMASSTWWKEREALDNRLRELLVNIEESWFGGFKSILCPSRRHCDAIADFRHAFEGVLGRHIPALEPAILSNLPDATLRLYLDLCHDQSTDIDIDTPVLDLLYSVVDSFRFNGQEVAYDEIDFDTLTVEIVGAIEACHAEHNETEASHLILVLDKKLQNFPWESLPYLEKTSISRMGDMLSLRERLSAMNKSNTKVVERIVVKKGFGTAILDPAADIRRTRDTLKPVLDRLHAQKSWKLISEQDPTEDEFKQALAQSSIVLYFGHGAGSQYIRPRSVKRLSNCSEVVWLMGCSSGSVVENDELEATSVPASYFLAGHAMTASDEAEADRKKCMAVVANLWDVTDKDIDRFSIAVGEEWGLWQQSSAVKHEQKRSVRRDPLHTPPLSPKTPKTPRVAHRTASKTPSRARSRSARIYEPCSLTEAVSRSRDACYLRYLNGAAPVVYGLPVYLDVP